MDEQNLVKQPSDPLWTSCAAAGHQGAIISVTRPFNLLVISVIRLLEEERRRAGVFGARQELQQQVQKVQEENRALKVEYDALLEQQREEEKRLREEKVAGGQLLEDMIYLKKQAADRMNSHNERRSRYLNAPHTPVCLTVTEQVRVPEHTTWSVCFHQSSRSEAAEGAANCCQVKGHRGQVRSTFPKSPTSVSTSVSTHICP